MAPYANHITTSLLRIFRPSYGPVQCKWWPVAERSNERSALLGVALLYYTCLYSRSRPLFCARQFAQRPRLNILSKKCLKYKFIIPGQRLLLYERIKIKDIWIYFYILTQREKYITFKLGNFFKKN